MLKRIIHNTHSLLGAVVSLLFLMWFITGLVLVYHAFPDVNNTERNKNREAIQTTTPLPNVSEILTAVQGDKAKLLQLNQYQDQAVFTLATTQGTEHISAGLDRIASSISLEQIRNTASRWSDAPIARIDTLDKQDIWVMYSKYIKELPLYKVHIDDADKHQLYLSSKTGEVQQYTSFSQRVWAYFGSIPHKLYIPALRVHTDIWINTITVLATLCFIVSLSGIILGIRALYKRYKRKGKIESPYVKRSYKWHHIGGLLFGLFLLTWSISGMVALRKTPQWLVKTHSTTNVAKQIKGKAISPLDYTLDYRKVIDHYPDIKQLKWSYFQGIPFYEIVVGDQVLSIDASTDTVKSLEITPNTIDQAVEALHGKDAEYTLNLIDNYEDYYLPWKREIPLPVYRAEVNSPDNDCYYISPNSGYYKHMNNNRIARKWLFNAFHYAHIQWLMERPILWTFVVWGLSLGCIVVSATGVVLSLTY